MMDAHQMVSHQLSARAQNSNTSLDSTGSPPDSKSTVAATIFKGPKRKRLVKACDACHKSKRRCDGTAPCSNCYFAWKECTYTDSAGRSVPAPNANRQEGATTHSRYGSNIHNDLGLPDAALAYASQRGPVPSNSYAHSNVPYGPGGIHPPFGSTSGTTPTSPIVGQPTRKRLRDERDVNQQYDSRYNSSAHPSGLPANDPGPSATGPSMENSYLRSTNTTVAPDAYHGIDRNVIRELVNLFFAHCHPHRLIIHFPTFNSDLCHDRVPSYLLNAICALAAPLSRSPRIRVEPVREAGQKFAEAALSSLFGRDGRIKDNTLQAAQALVLLQAYKIYKESHMNGEFTYFDEAVRILHHLPGFRQTNQPPLITPLPSESLQVSLVQAECARRTFWLVHLIEALGTIFTRRPTSHSLRDLANMRLPCDEFSFEFNITSTLPEYLNVEALELRSKSEFAHVLRITTLLSMIEECNLDSPDARAVTDLENKLEQWVIGLSDDLKYNAENLQMQLSFWETSINSNTWCFCFMHVQHACCILALSDIRRRLGADPCRGRIELEAIQTLSAIMNGVGARARNSIMMGCVLWVQYCGPHAPRIAAENGSQNSNADPSAMYSKAPNNPELQPYLEQWLKEWEEFWGPPHHQPSESKGRGDDEEVQRRVTQSSSALIETGDVKDFSNRTMNTTAKAQWDIPDVIIDPVLRGESDHPPIEVYPQPSPALSSTSTLKGRDLLSLPSLKSSGLLDVATDESSARSGSTTPVRSTWSVTGPSSPRPPYSPGQSTSLAATGSSGSSPTRSPHMPQEIFPPAQPLPQPQAQYQLAPQSVPSMTPSHATLQHSGTNPTSLINPGVSHYIRGHHTDNAIHTPPFSEQIRR